MRYTIYVFWSWNIVLVFKLKAYNSNWINGWKFIFFLLSHPTKCIPIKLLESWDVNRITSVCWEHWKIMNSWHSKEEKSSSKTCWERNRKMFRNVVSQKNSSETMKETLILSQKIIRKIDFYLLNRSEAAIQVSEVLNEQINHYCGFETNKGQI